MGRLVLSLFDERLERWHVPWYDRQIHRTDVEVQDVSLGGNLDIGSAKIAALALTCFPVEERMDWNCLLLGSKSENHLELQRLEGMYS